MPRWIVLLTLLCLPVSAHAAGRADESGGKELKKELKKAEAVLSKLRRLGEASRSAEQSAFAKAARKLYPGLFASVSGLREGGLRTELATAVALYESALRAEGKAAAADCSREVRDVYARLCVEAGGERAPLLRAKARLHAARAECELLYARGDRSPATLEASADIRAERGTDRALAEEALWELKRLAGELGGAESEAEARGANRTARANATPADRLEQIDRLLSSIPRDRTRQLLAQARDAFRDGLYWQLKAGPARALFVDARSYAAEPGALPRLGLRADDAGRAALANLRAALDFIRRAEESLGH
jgi:hypothetical protein